MSLGIIYFDLFLSFLRFLIPPLFTKQAFSRSFINSRIFFVIKIVLIWYYFVKNWIYFKSTINFKYFHSSVDYESYFTSQ